MKVIIGAGGTTQPGWESLEQDDLDIRDKTQWDARFVPNSLEAILAEHVFEHLTVEEGYLAALNCYRYLRRGGYLRIAVPDGFHPEPNEWLSSRENSANHFVNHIRAPDKCRRVSAVPSARV